MSNYKALMAIALDRGGLFTFTEALSCGYLAPNIASLIKSETFERLGHGIYRLADIERGPCCDFVALSLWGRGKKKTGDESSVFISHASAVAYYGLGDFMPRYPVDVTVAENKKITAAPPVKIHRHEDLLGYRMIAYRDGFFVSSPLRALTETFLDGNFEPDALYAAGKDAIDRGLIEPSEIHEFESVIPKALLVSLNTFIKRRRHKCVRVTPEG